MSHAAPGVMTPTSAFELGRMRHLDLLALYFQLHPAAKDGPSDQWLGGLSHDSLAAAILCGGAR